MSIEASNSNFYTSPCQLLHEDDNKMFAMVKFPNGLNGRPVFSEKFEYMQKFMSINGQNLWINNSVKKEDYKLTDSDYSELCSMKPGGVIIPDNKQHEYPELKDRQIKQIYVEDKNFGKALYEIYFGTIYPGKFHWESMKDNSNESKQNGTKC